MENKENIIDSDFDIFINTVFEIRGKLLQTCIELELKMDGYIAEHFCETEEKIIEFGSIVLAPRISWGEKLNIFSVIIEKYNPDFLKEYPSFHSDIKKIIEHRTVFAHYPADTTITGVERFKNTRMPETSKIVYASIPSSSNEDINSILMGIHTYTTAIDIMIRIGK
jgi:hypothetical protein